MFTRIAVLSAATILILGGVACSDDPFAIRWEADPTEATLYSLQRPELSLPSGFDFVTRRAVQIEAAASTNRWDLALDGEGDQLAFLPPGALGVNSRAGIAALPGMSFEDVREAPSDTARYERVGAVPLEMGTVYVIRTRQEQNAWGQVCVFYAKLELLEIDTAENLITFVFDASPACNNRRLVP